MLTDIKERDVPKGASLSLSSGKGKKVSHDVPEKGGNDRPSSFFCGSFGVRRGVWAVLVWTAGELASGKADTPLSGDAVRRQEVKARGARMLLLKSRGSLPAAMGHQRCTPDKTFWSSALLRDPAAAGTACAGHSATLGVQKAPGRALRGASKAGEGVALSVQKTRCGEHGFLRTRLFPTQ